jgi:hypothetical protein
MAVVVAALAFGVRFIAVIARYAQNVPRADPRAQSAAPDARPPITPREFESVHIHRTNGQSDRSFAD